MRRPDGRSLQTETIAAKVDQRHPARHRPEHDARPPFAVELLDDADLALERPREDLHGCAGIDAHAGAGAATASR